MKKEGPTIKGTKEGIVIGIKEKHKLTDLKATLKKSIEDYEELLATENRIIIDVGNRNLSSKERKEIAKLVKKSINRSSIQILWSQSKVTGQVISMETREEIDLKVKNNKVKEAVSNSDYEISINPEPEIKVSESDQVKENSTLHKSTEIGEEETLLIKRTLRSGQSIQFDGNVVVLGDVNPGAEIVASGNIVIMGSFRGVAHAGAMGDESAVVTAFRLQPTQLRIANHITRAPDGEYLPPDQPEVARIKEGVVMIEAYQTNLEKQMKIG